MIKDVTQTPFNVGRRVELRDFTREEMKAFEVARLGKARLSAELIDRVYYWCSGHPFLTQSVLLQLSEAGKLNLGPADVDNVVREMFFALTALSSNPNLHFVSVRMLPGQL